MYRQADTHTKDLTLGAILSTSPDIRLYPGKKEKQTVIYTVRRLLAGQEGPIPSADRRPPTHTQTREPPRQIHTNPETSPKLWLLHDHLDHPAY